MAALTKPRRLREERWNRQSFNLPTGTTAFENGAAMLKPSTGKVLPAVTGAGQGELVCLGTFAETVANASGVDQPVVVQLKRELKVVWFANDGTNPVTATDISKTVYLSDDQTVSISSATSTRGVAGIAWAIDSTLGVAVELT